MPFVQQEKLDQESNGTYTTLLKARVSARTNASVVVANAHASHNLLFKVLVSNDVEGANGTWAEDKAETTITGGSNPIRHVLTGPFIWIDVQIKSVGAGESPHGSAWLLGVGL